MTKKIKVEEYEKLFRKVNRSLDKKIKALKSDTERIKESSKLDDTNKNSKSGWYRNTSVIIEP